MQSQNLLGLAIANLKSYVEGVADTITALSLSYNSTTEEYSYTPTATLVAADTVVVELVDGSKDVALVGTKYYKGKTDTIVTVA